MGIEPTSSAWKAEVLPLNYTRRARPGSIRAHRPVLAGPPRNNNRNADGSTFPGFAVEGSFFALRAAQNRFAIFSNLLFMT